MPQKPNSEKIKMNNNLWEKEKKERKYSLWKNVKNFGAVLSIAGLLFAAYHFYKGTRDNILDQKEAKKIAYGFIGMMVGPPIFYLGDFKQNKLEQELQNEDKTNSN